MFYILLKCNKINKVSIKKRCVRVQASKHQEIKYKINTYIQVFICNAPSVFLEREKLLLKL